MSNDYYLSIDSISRGYYQEKGSKFYAYVYPVTQEEAIKEHLDTLRKQHYDARHHCYAFVLKPLEGQEERFRANDDGEPTHSAGDPILGQIRSSKLYDVLIVVVRYFGGTKLGVGGLVNAYRAAAADALAHNRIVRKVRREIIKIQFEYTATNEVQRVLHQYQAEIISQQFAQDCYYQLRVPQSQFEVAKQQFAAVPGVVVK